MSRFEVDVSLDRVERWAANAGSVQRLTRFMRAVTEDRMLQVSGAVSVASLWLAFAFGDPRFLVLLLTAGLSVWRYRRLEQRATPDEDDWL
jgi:hypothetical protein